jgi:hypothetical protein
MMEKPTLTLCDPAGSDPLDELAAMYEKMTGHAPTTAEIEDARAYLAQHSGISIAPKK